MNDQQDVFQLNVDDTAKYHMLEAARWGKFMAIMGFIGIGLLIVLGLFAGSILSSMPNMENSGLQSTMRASMFFIYVILAGVYFYPVYALLKFSNLIKVAINTSNQGQFNEAFRFLKSMFKYIGIVTIVILSLYLLVIIVVMIGFAMR